MTAAPLQSKVDDFLAQRRIAVAGVSRHANHHPVGNLIYGRLKATGHDVVPVNPNMTSFEGEPCFPDVQSIPGGVDGVVIITRPETTERIARDCAQAGVKRIWIHSSLGKGSSVSDEAVEYCNQQGMTVIAGACPMMYAGDVDFGHACTRWLLGISGRLPS